METGFNKWRKLHRDEDKERCRTYYELNREHLKSKALKKYHHAKSNGKRIGGRCSVKTRLRRQKIRLKTDVHFRIKRAISSRIYKKIKLCRGTCEASTVDILGCSVEKLRKHLESQFVHGMTWDNHGIRGWHIDHIKPCCKFDLSNEAEVRACFHYTNLQPLWYLDNIEKSGN